MGELIVMAVCGLLGWALAEVSPRYRKWCGCDEE